MKGQTEHQRQREIEKTVLVSVIDLADRSERCQACNAKGFTLFVHCFREPNRPIVALCKPCTIQRAGGVEKVYVTNNRGPGLHQRWKAGARIALRTDDQITAFKEAVGRKVEKASKVLE
jgi:hypothetical protein